MKIKFYANLVVAMLVACFAATSAEAARRPAHTAPVETSVWSLWDAPAASERQARPARAYKGRASTPRAARPAREVSSSRSAPSHSGVGPRPAKWCGWYMRTQLGGGPEYNLASSWRRYGSATSPQVGAVVVWPHHVGIITGQTASGQWIVKSGNMSGRVHEGPRSVSGATFRI
jgi:hypothetical protein